MRAAREAEIQNRQNVLAQMKEDARYTERAQESNLRIQTQNDQNQLRQLQADASVSQRNFENQQQAATTIFGSVAKLSQTAAKKLEEIETQKFEEESQKAILEFDPNSDEVIKQIRGEGELAAQEELRQGALDNVVAAGGNPLAVAQARAMSSGYRYGLDQARANYLWNVVYPDRLQKAKTENQDTFATSGGASAFLVDFQRKFTQETGLLKLKPEMMRDGLTSVKTLHQGILGQVRRLEEENLYAMQDDNATTILTNNPAAFTQNALTSFRTWARNPKNGYAGALDKFEALATLRGPDGKFLFTMEQLSQAVLKEGGRGFAFDWPSRFANMQLARVKTDLEFRNTEIAADNVGFLQDEKRVLEGLVKDPSKKNADAAVKFFRGAWGRVPDSINKFQLNYTTEAVEKAKAIERLEAIPDGFITQEAVDAAQGLDYAAGKKLADRFANQERRYSTGIYKETLDSFKTTANGATSFGTNKPNTAASVVLQAYMQAEYRKRVDEAVAGGMDFNTASASIGIQLDKEVKAGLRDPNSKWYRKTDGPGGAATFPGLTKGALPAAEQARRRYEYLKKRIKEDGIEEVLDTKDSILTASEAQNITRKYGKPGFTIPQDVLAVAGTTNGLDPMTIINRQLVAQGMKPLKPPPSLDTTNQTISPAFKRLLYKTPSVLRSVRGLGSANTFNPDVIPRGYGPIIQESAQRSGVNPSYIAALADVESGFNPTKPSYNNTSFGVMQINKASHPGFFAQQNWKDPRANIAYGTQYYSIQLKKYGDPVAAAMAYNAGPGNYDAYLRGELPDGPIKREMLNHGKKFAAALYKYGGAGTALNNPHLMRSGNGNLQLSSSATSYVGMDTSEGPSAGKNACVWAVSKVMRSAGLPVPWGTSLYVPEVKRILDQTARRVPGPVPGAIAIMQDNHPTDPFPHMGIVGPDGMIISNSSSRAKFDWRGTPQEYEQKYGRPNLYYMLN
jgi:hypothetical protein